jgi:hypothetical protein
MDSVFLQPWKQKNAISKLNGKNFFAGNGNEKSFSI